MTARSIAPPSAVLPTVLLAVLLAGCGSPERHCEYDATNADVPPTYCAQEIDGYEWEDGPADDDLVPLHHSRRSRTTRPDAGVPGVGGPTPKPDRSRSRSTRSHR